MLGNIFLCISYLPMLFLLSDSVNGLCCCNKIVMCKIYPWYLGAMLLGTLMKMWFICFILSMIGTNLLKGY